MKNSIIQNFVDNDMSSDDSKQLKHCRNSHRDIDNFDKAGTTNQHASRCRLHMAVTHSLPFPHDFCLFGNMIWQHNLGTGQVENMSASFDEFDPGRSRTTLSINPDFGLPGRTEGTT